MLPLASPISMSTVLLVLLALGPIRICYALFLFVFLVSYWSHVLLCPVSNGNRWSLKSNRISASVRLFAVISQMQKNPPVLAWWNSCTTWHLTAVHLEVVPLLLKNGQTKLEIGKWVTLCGIQKLNWYMLCRMVAWDLQMLNREQGES